ncbi:hypothetical protein [Corynebacterium sp. A21]|uniref:hypothetical protein n=1 Tax=Corynebacterium sp. A21 TaxID=3457318 RepID=UPI003FD32FFB
MGFWRRLLNRDEESNDAIAEKLRFREEPDTPVEDLVEDPRERARALATALELAGEFGFEPRREITVDDVPFDRLGGIKPFSTERLSTLLQLKDEAGPLFPRYFYLEYDFVESNDAYAHILQKMAAATGTAEQFSEIHCDLHFGPDFQLHPIGEFRYIIRGTTRNYEVSSEGDFADPTVVDSMFTDTTPSGYTRISTVDSAHNYWVPTDHTERFRTLLRAEETAAEDRHLRWQIEHNS